MNTIGNKKANEILRLRARQIMEFSRQQFTKTGKRGFVTLVAKNSPENPFKAGRFYYTTEEQNDKLSLTFPYKTEYDINLERDLREYNPSSEAVVLVWYKTLYKEVRMKDTTSWN